MALIQKVIRFIEVSNPTIEVEYDFVPLAGLLKSSTMYRKKVSSRSYTTPAMMAVPSFWFGETKFAWRLTKDTMQHNQIKLKLIRKQNKYLQTLEDETKMSNLLAWLMKSELSSSLPLYCHL